MEPSVEGVPDQPKHQERPNHRVTRRCGRRRLRDVFLEGFCGALQETFAVRCRLPTIGLSHAKPPQPSLAYPCGFGCYIIRACPRRTSMFDRIALAAALGLLILGMAGCA